MTGLPEPLTPPGCDLRDYPWMPLDTRRLLKSATWIKGAAEAKVAAMTLWCEAWHQVPAGSIEDDDESTTNQPWPWRLRCRATRRPVCPRWPTAAGPPASWCASSRPFRRC